MIHVDKLLSLYDLDKITIGVLGGHSALDVCRGAKRQGFNTIAVCQRGREKTYDKYFRSRDGKGIVDETIILEKFLDITSPAIIKKLQDRNTIFIHNRYFWVYFDFNDIESKFDVPIFGTRGMLRLEERDVENNQYSLLTRAGIRIPKIFKKPGDIDCLVIVKVNEAKRRYERAFFLCNSPGEFTQKSQKMLSLGIINKEGLAKAVIEEYILGAQINFNFFYSPLSRELELMGTDIRRQTNLDGLLRLPANEQMAVLKYMGPKLIETGHVSVTVKESLLEKAFELGERFVAVSQKVISPGIIGPFALQGAVTAEAGKEDIAIFDVSMRIPGSPGTMFTPYSGYLYGDSISYGERIAMEIKRAIKENKLDLILT